MFINVIEKSAIVILILLAKDVIITFISPFFVRAPRGIIVEITVSGFYLPFSLLLRKHFYYFSILVAITYFGIKDLNALYNNGNKRIIDKTLYYQQKLNILKKKALCFAVFDIVNKASVASAPINYIYFIFVLIPYSVFKNHIFSLTMFVTIICFVIGRVYLLISMLIRKFIKIDA